ncbi:GFA family protein [Candidatus Uabimicrobium amorphum]|uniref:Aldehyde-activating protein n=1 Tax=Uabimicrobium amorphum TaxID=2596890 RepID=A0A5S9F4M4_UABAM|nr:GFA family protein [Candidatus Uabimicrobium amorphum]BBM84634.1 aldehyde-activating protein [Candidatus Uabimicrobium amorphum]
MEKITGSCLCGGVVFEVQKITGPFELCHCNRCRKATGSAYAAMVSVHSKNIHLTCGKEFIGVYDTPIREKPPAYRSIFCRNCGSPLPDFFTQQTIIEIPAGLLDKNFHVKPDKHIYVEYKPTWSEIHDALPQFTKKQIKKWRENL